MGLTVLNLVGAFPQYAKSIDNTGDYGWIRHQCGYQTLEFRLLPSTVDREEWLAYLAIISWFAYKFHTDATETFQQILDRSVEELLKGIPPFNDWPPALFDILSRKRTSIKSRVHRVADRLAPAQAIA